MLSHWGQYGIVYLISCFIFPQMCPCCSADLHPSLLLCDVTKWFVIPGFKLTHLLMRLFYFPFTCKLFIHFSTCIICWRNAPGVWRPSETHWRNDKLRSSHLPITNGYSLQLLTAVDLQTYWHLSDSRHGKLPSINNIVILSSPDGSASACISYHKIRWRILWGNLAEITCLQKSLQFVCSNWLLK